MQSVRALKLIPAWVGPDHLVSTARIVLQGHRLRALGVIENGQLVGVVTRDSLAGHPDNEEVRAAMEPVTNTITADMTVRQVAEVFVRDGLEYAPVLDKERFLGIVTANLLLKELGRSWDPLTSLSWSDVLREWGIENLKQGTEITIVFFDLDEFGQYNKRFGHIVGDRVLQRVAGILRDATDPSRDVLVRYGGDEFAIGTTRPREETEAFVQSIAEKMREVLVGDSEVPVTFSVGIYGGKRTRERENVHYAATLDNLINLSSKACMEAKASKTTKETEVLYGPSTAAIVEMRDGVEQSQPPAPEPEPKEPAKIHRGPIRVVSVFADDQSSNSLTQVILSVGENVVSGVSARMGKPVIESVALATAKALERKFPEEPLRVGDIHLAQGPDGERLVSVSGTVGEGTLATVVGGVCPLGNDLFLSAAQATVDAFLSGSRSGII